MICEDDANNTQSGQIQKEEAHLQDKKNTTFDVNEATKNATIVDYLDNPYYEGDLPEPVEIQIGEEYVLSD